MNRINHRDFAAVGQMTHEFANRFTVGAYVDFYARGTGDKLHGKVTRRTANTVWIQPLGGPAQRFSLV